MNWKQAFRKFLWMPVLLFVLYTGGFIYDATNIGLHWPLAQVYLIAFSLYVVLLYFPFVLYAKYPTRMTYTLLLCLLGLFAIGALKGVPLADATRSFIQSHIDLSFFTGFLTVAALLIAVEQILNVKKKRT